MPLKKSEFIGSIMFSFQSFTYKKNLKVQTSLNIFVVDFYSLSHFTNTNVADLNFFSCGVNVKFCMQLCQFVLHEFLDHCDL